ncbi:hypothetical protein FHS33_002704 [Streptomyces calvus]|uniref:Uncharacterized protein n=1 Tax=Streptomyces calvus TaxID=67282 RepID=A0AA40SDP1_9ACTN|nr:hypothetical protein [Streptomyces calvus]
MGTPTGRLETALVPELPAAVQDIDDIVGAVDESTAD